MLSGKIRFFLFLFFPFLFFFKKKSSNPRLRAEEDVEDLESSRQMIAFSNALHAWSIFAKYAVYRTATDTVARPDHPDPGREETKEN